MMINGPYIRIWTAVFARGHGFNANVISNVWLHNKAFLKNLVQTEKYNIQRSNILHIPYILESNPHPNLIRTQFLATS
jgi:hypothetical protein